MQRPPPPPLVGGGLTITRVATRGLAAAARGAGKAIAAKGGGRVGSVKSRGKGDKGYFKNWKRVEKSGKRIK